MRERGLPVCAWTESERIGETFLGHMESLAYGLNIDLSGNSYPVARILTCEISIDLPKPLLQIIKHRHAYLLYLVNIASAIFASSLVASLRRRFRLNVGHSLRDLLLEASLIR